MSVTLSEKLAQYVDTLGTESWNLAIREAFQGYTLSPELLNQLGKECLDQSIDTKQDYYNYCQKTLALVLLYQLSSYSYELMFSQLSPLYLKLIRYQYPKQLQLFTFYRALIAFFLKQEVDNIDLYEMNSGIVFGDYGGYDPEEHLPHFIRNGELALLAILLSFVTKNEELLKKSIKVSHWLSSFLEKTTMFPEGIWVKEKEFCLASLSLINSLLFQYTNSIAPHIHIEKAYKAIEKIFVDLPPHSLNFLGPLYPVLHLFLSKEMKKRSLPYMDLKIDQDARIDNRCLGFGEYHYQDFSCYCSASGVGSGVACFHKGGIQIVSLGPHFAALGDMQKYGIYRTSMMKPDPFKDIKIENTKNSFSFEGWTRVIDEKSAFYKPGSSWFYMNLFAKENHCKCRVKWINLQESPDLFLAFFVKAEKVIVDKNYHLHPHTLDRYHGKAAEIIFQNKNSFLNIKVSEFPFIQVIPLAGERHFWGAQFLVACSLPKDQEILFEII